MPEGFEKQLSEVELVDLLEFLAQRGKYLPLPLDRAATIVSTRGMFYGEESQGERDGVRGTGARRLSRAFLLSSSIRRTGRVPNAILMYSPSGPSHRPKMPKSVNVACNSAAKAIHLLSGRQRLGLSVYSGQGLRLAHRPPSIIRTAKTEDHPLKNGEHFADYIRKVDVPGSKYAFDLKGKQNPFT